MIEALRAAVIAIGKDVSGIKATEVGIYSIRSGAAMIMYLGECPVYTIMMIGRWSSDSSVYIIMMICRWSSDVFLRYTRT
jgi:hypothetical protein